MRAERIHPVSGKSRHNAGTAAPSARASPGVHGIGIGGIGVSALARLYRRRGYVVSGSDIARSEITDALRREGIHVAIGKHRSRNVPAGTMKVIYTAAVQPDNPELREARRRGIPVRTYAQAVGEFTRRYKTVAVAGSHGKSTTTALASLILMKAGLDPTVIVGAKLPALKNSNFRAGKSTYLVLEADEYRASFLNYSPAIAVITNIDREHLDFYRTIRNVEGSFLKFLLRLQAQGMAVLNGDDPRLRRMAPRLRRARPDLRIVWYSLQDSAARKIRNIIRIPGEHNVSNAAAAHAVGRLLRVPERKILAAIGAYRGAWRRFDYQGKLLGAKVFADYAHHPTEIKATLQAAREKFPKSRIWCVFQPHHHERLKSLFPEFSRAFKSCHAVILLDVYEVAGRERRGRAGSASSERLARAVSRNKTPALYLQNPRNLRAILARWLKPGDVLLMMGAGDIWEVTKELMKSKGKGERGKVQKLA